MKHSYILFLSFFFIINITLGQESILTTGNENPILRSTYKIYELIVDHTKQQEKPLYPVSIDTFNICRVQKSGIKGLTIYYFKDVLDSVVWQDIQYKPNGLILSMKPAIGWYMYADINPDLVNIDCSSFKNEKDLKKSLTKKKVSRKSHTREIYKYDSLGYLTSYTKTTTGIINRWFTKTIGDGIVKYQNLYTYSNDYKIVAVSYYLLDKIKSKKCIELEYDYVICEFDEFGNIHSEMKYKNSAVEKPMFVNGFKYYYSYF